MSNTTPSPTEYMPEIRGPGTTEVLNPFDRAAIVAAEQMSVYNFTGTTNEDSPKSYDYITSQSNGWKLHLNFDAEDPSKVSTVQDLLSALNSHGVVGIFKIGDGGGRAEGEPGKEATVIVGHRDKAVLVADIIEQLIGDKLDDIHPEALKTDIPITPKIAARFDIDRVDPRFNKYGFPGFQELVIETRKRIVEKPAPGSLKSRDLLEASRKVSYDTLRETYGKYYTGSWRPTPARVVLAAAQ